MLHAIARSIATEELLAYLYARGIDTGIDPDALADAVNSPRTQTRKANHGPESADEEGEIDDDGE